MCCRYNAGHPQMRVYLVKCFINYFSLTKREKRTEIAEKDFFLTAYNCHLLTETKLVQDAYVFAVFRKKMQGFTRKVILQLHWFGPSKLDADYVFPSWYVKDKSRHVK